MSAEYSNTSMLDMVFENRNKAYGAYVHRSESNERVRTAMLMLLSILTVLCVGNYIRDNMRGKPPVANSFPITVAPKDIEVPKPAEKPKKAKPPVILPQQTAQAVASVAHVEQRVVANNQVHNDTIPNTRDLATADAGLTTNTDAGKGIGVTDGTGNSQVLEVAREVAPARQEVINVAEIMPEFPGGERALMNFIARNTEYPAMERDNGIAGKVLTQFTVNEDGSIADVKILRSPSPGFNKEVTRVLGKLPHFKPGMQQGRAVRVRYVLPFTFNLN